MIDEGEDFSQFFSEVPPLQNDLGDGYFYSDDIDESQRGLDLREQYLYQDEGDAMWTLDHERINVLFKDSTDKATNKGSANSKQENEYDTNGSCKRNT